MRRVLRPGGRLIFVEHGLSPEVSTARWQHRLTPVLEAHQRRLSSRTQDGQSDPGCWFQIDAIEMAYMKGPKSWTFMYQGSATRASFY
jgi:hypothetical protein